MTDDAPAPVQPLTQGVKRRHQRVPGQWCRVVEALLEGGLQRFQFLAERAQELWDLPVDLVSVNGVKAGEALAAQQFRVAHGVQPRGRRARTATTVWLARSDASASVEAS